MDAFEFQHFTSCIAQAQLLPLASVRKVGSESRGASRGGKMWNLFDSFGGPGACGEHLKVLSGQDLQFTVHFEF